MCRRMFIAVSGRPDRRELLHERRRRRRHRGARPRGRGEHAAARGSGAVPAAAAAAAAPAAAAQGPVHLEQTVRERVWPGQGGGSGECARVNYEETFRRGALPPAAPRRMHVTVSVLGHLASGAYTRPLFSST